MLSESDPEPDSTRAELIAAASARLRSSAGWAAHLRWTTLARSYKVFQLNAHELLAVLKGAEDMASGTMALLQDRAAYFAALDQRLHNLLASATTLVDHTRRTLREYNDTEFSRNFQQRNDAVRSSGEASFLRRLRNFLLHFGVLDFVHRLSFDAAKGPEAESHVELRKADLLTWDGWDSASKQYLADNGGSIHLLIAVESYISQMASLYDWVFSQFDALHGRDMDDTNELVREYNLVLSNGRFDLPPANGQAPPNR